MATERDEIRTASDMLQAMAVLMRRRGRSDRKAIIPTACEIIAAPGARPRDLTEHESIVLDELLAFIEDGLACPIPVWEHIHTLAEPWEVAWRLDMIAAGRRAPRAITAA